METNQKVLAIQEQLELWEYVKQLNLDVGLKQETLDEIEAKVQERIAYINTL